MNFLCANSSILMLCSSRFDGPRGGGRLPPTGYQQAAPQHNTPQQANGYGPSYVLKLTFYPESEFF